MCAVLHAACTQVIIKCEQRVQAMQGEHVSELSKRDYIMQRAKDTILKLEATVAGGHPEYVPIIW